MTTDNERARIIWANVLEALEGSSRDDAIEAARTHARNAHDTEDELLLLFTSTAGVLGTYLARFLGPEGAHEFLTLTLFAHELDQLNKNEEHG